MMTKARSMRFREMQNNSEKITTKLEIKNMMKSSTTWKSSTQHLKLSVSWGPNTHHAWNVDQYLLKGVRQLPLGTKRNPTLKIDRVTTIFFSQTEFCQNPNLTSTQRLGLT